MESLRLVPGQKTPGDVPCCRCTCEERSWDRLAGLPLCPECQEALIMGLAAPLCLPTERRRCAVCSRTGTIRYLTYPLNLTVPVEMDLCSEHIRALLGRRLGSYAYHRIRRRLHDVGLSVEHIFLLHDAFYDANGRALQPAQEAE